ncbi:MAG: hypothetical protein A3J67_05125 [Parcubacteria group bacterium RIFCSPHIGHO2_02_FULL_48_10b]|nr:MAG: hypothetical protein A3J67_05125 [Parcubacteria group bacterium RIFCSPHIGHO2_02_FULL_48_10b]
MQRAAASKIRAFQKEVWGYYRLHKRGFPWRKTKNPYRILVSEIMLQQTQADRVVLKYKEFIKKFPNLRALSKASLKSVLRAWQGLGYNRRAVHLKTIAREVTVRFGGKLPSEKEILMSSPGIGQSTAGAVRTFAFNKPEVFVETNIRTAFIHFFFPKKQKILDSDISKIVEVALDRKNPREWYWALMDYGAMLKKAHGNAAARRSAHYARQSPFKGSSREQRSKILKMILGEKISTKKLLAKTGFSKQILAHHLADLSKEGFIRRSGNYFIVSK